MTLVGFSNTYPTQYELTLPSPINLFFSVSLLPMTTFTCTQYTFIFFQVAILTTYEATEEWKQSKKIKSKMF